MKTALWLALALALAAVLWWLDPPDFAAGQSLEDTVRESEGGQMPSQEEFSKRSAPTPGRWKAVIRYHGGPTVTIPNVADCDAAMQSYAGSGKTVTCEREEDPTSPGRSLAPPTIYAFFGWAADGRFLGASNFDTAEQCEAQLDRDRARYPRVQFSLCVMLWAERPTL